MPRGSTRTTTEYAGIRRGRTVGRREGGYGAGGRAACGARRSRGRVGGRGRRDLVADQEMTAILQEVTSRLDAESIPYMLAGSFAMLYYALPRMTRDIDLVVQLDQKDAERIYELFCKDYYVSLDAIKEAIHTLRVFNIIHEAAVIKIDFFVIPREGFFGSEFSRRTKVNLLGKAISLISPEDLVISKLMWARDAGSAQQMADVANLLMSLQNLDRSYIEAWVAQLGLEEWYEKCRRDGRA